MLRPVHKKIVLNENNKPVEVIISYEEWKEIEQILEASGRQSMPREKLKAYAGVMHIEEDPMEYQRRMRSEWK